MVTVSGPGVQIGGEAGAGGGGGGVGGQIHYPPPPPRRRPNAWTEKAWKDAVHLGTWQGIVHTSWNPSAEANCDGNIK